MGWFRGQMIKDELRAQSKPSLFDVFDASTCNLEYITFQSPFWSSWIIIDGVTCATNHLSRNLEENQPSFLGPFLLQWSFFLPEGYRPFFPKMKQRASIFKDKS